MRKSMVPPATVLPAIKDVRTKGDDDLYIGFEHPLAPTQTSLVRNICLNLQDAPKNFIFAYAIILGMPENGKKPPLRQIDNGGAMLHITRSKVRGRKPSLEAIALSIAQRMSAYSSD